MLTAREIMTDGTVTIHPEASVKDAIELLLEKRISGLPVIDEKGHLVGVITEYALLAIIYDREVEAADRGHAHDHGCADGRYRRTDQQS